MVGTVRLFALEEHLTEQLSQLFGITDPKILILYVIIAFLAYAQLRAKNVGKHDDLMGALIEQLGKQSGQIEKIFEKFDRLVDQEQVRREDREKEKTDERTKFDNLLANYQAASTEKGNLLTLLSTTMDARDKAESASKETIDGLAKGVELTARLLDSSVTKLSARLDEVAKDNRDHVTATLKSLKADIVEDFRPLKEELNEALKIIRSLIESIHMARTSPKVGGESMDKVDAQLTQSDKVFDPSKTLPLRPAELTAKPIELPVVPPSESPKTETPGAPTA